MNTNGIVDVMRRVVAQETAGIRTALLGVVTQTFPHQKEDDENNYEVSVRLKYEKLELPRVPVAAPVIGAALPLKKGDLVLVQFLNGDLSQPVVTGRFYHDAERPPLHEDGELLVEHRVEKDSSLNHFRSTPDGTIYIQRKVEKPEDNSEAATSLKIDGETGDIEILVGEVIEMTLSAENGITLKTGDDFTLTISKDGKDVQMKCGAITIEAGDGLTFKGPTTIDGTLEVTDKTTLKADADVSGKLKVGAGPSTIIDGNKIQGA